MTDRREPATDLWEAVRETLLRLPNEPTMGGIVWYQASSRVLTEALRPLLALAIEIEAAAPREAPDQRLRDALLRRAVHGMACRSTTPYDPACTCDLYRALATEGEPTGWRCDYPSCDLRYRHAHHPNGVAGATEGEPT